VQITAPGEPFSGGYSSPQNGRGISELALWADAPELPASAPFVMSASLVRPAPSSPPHSAADGVDALHGNLRCRSGIERLIGAGHRADAADAAVGGYRAVHDAAAGDDADLAAEHGGGRDVGVGVDRWDKARCWIVTGLVRTAVPGGLLVAMVLAGAVAGAVSVAFTTFPFLARARRGIGSLMGGHWLPDTGGWFHLRGR